MLASLFNKQVTVEARFYLRALCWIYLSAYDSVWQLTRLFRILKTISRSTSERARNWRRIL